MNKLVELKKSELKEIEGGWIRLAIGLGIAAGAAIMRDWDDFTAGLRGECC